MPHSTLLTRVVRKIREVGVLYTLTLGIRVLLPVAIFRFTRMVIFQILPSDIDVPVVSDGRIRWATLRDCRCLEAFGHGPDHLKGRFAGGARVCILSEEETLLAYVWFHGPHHDEGDLGVRFSLGPGEIWLFDAMVKAEQRGRGLYPRLLEAAARDLGREGVRRILTAVETANSNSLRAHQAAGATPIGMIWGIRALGFTVARHKRGVVAAWTGAGGYVRLPTSSIA